MKQCKCKRYVSAVSEQQINVMDAGAKLYAVDWSPDGSQLVYGGEDGVVKIIDVPEDFAVR